MSEFGNIKDKYSDDAYAFVHLYDGAYQTISFVTGI